MQIFYFIIQKLSSTQADYIYNIVKKKPNKTNNTIGILQIYKCTSIPAIILKSCLCMKL